MVTSPRRIGLSIGIAVVVAACGSPVVTFTLTGPADPRFTLDERVDAGWVHRFNLISDGAGWWERSWWLPGDGTVEVPDIGVLGPGPDRIEIPPPAGPGDYRLCTGNAGRNVCAEIRIIDADAEG